MAFVVCHVVNYIHPGTQPPYCIGIMPPGLQGNCSPPKTVHVEGWVVSWPFVVEQPISLSQQKFYDSFQADGEGPTTNTVVATSSEDSALFLFLFGEMSIAETVL